ncbi:S-(hydroxymethyl)glutathione dehydrogenase / alcohol dehydrogenase [Marmoricola sp. URHA0025 HA25]
MTGTIQERRHDGAVEETVRAAVIDERGAERFRSAEVRLSALQPGEVLVDVKAAGLCHSDWNFVTQNWGNPFPALLGHELAGVVEAVGEGVTEVEVGDHVVACGVTSCGECQNCIDGGRVWCLRTERSRRSPDAPPRLSTAEGEPLWTMMNLGAFAQKTIVHQLNLVAIDRAVPFDRACVLGCAVATGAGAVIRTAQVKPGESVVVIGAGGVGLNAIQAAALVGARKVIAVDVQDDKLALAKRFGATHVVNGAAVDAVAAVRELTGGLGVEHAFEMTGLEKPLQDGYDMLRRNGTVYIVGMQALGSTFSVPSAEFFRGTSVRAVTMGSANFKVDIPLYAELYLQGRFNLDDLVGRRLTLDQIDEGYAEMLGGGGVARSVITFEERS